MQLFHAAPNQYRPKFHILLTTFELARKEELVNLLRQRRVFFGALVVDEAHRLKGMNSQIWQAIQVLRQSDTAVRVANWLRRDRKMDP